MLRHILVCGALLLLCACGENLPNKEQQNKINESSQSASDNRDLDNDLNGNVILSLPGDPASVFDNNYYQRINELDPAAAIKTDFLRGGLIYDTWWTFMNGSVGTAPPVTSVSHPAWPTLANANLNTIATWRCVTCHGWDYIGVEGAFSDPNNPSYSGIGGIVQASPSSPAKLSDPGAIYEFIHSGQTVLGLAHDFGVHITDVDIYALTRFIVTLQSQAADLTKRLTPASVIDLVSKKVSADQSKGFVQYHNAIENGACDENCHGKDGQLISLGSLQGDDLSVMANNDPWQVLHKIRFGQPGSIPFMPGTSLSNDEARNFESAANTLAYVQMGLIRNYVRGGRLYDNLFAETAQLAPTIYNHLWDQRDFSYDAPIVTEDSWTCSGCHGYDYFGQIGFDNNLLYLRERPWTEDYVFKQLSEGFSVRVWPDPLVLAAHDYKTLLNEDDLWDLVAFLMNGVTDTYRYIYTTWSSVGDFDAGRELFQTPYGSQGACVTCHGLDGLGGGVVDNPTVDIFAFSWDAPWEFLHKVRFGVAGKNMPAIENSQIVPGDVMAVEVASDIHQYSQQRLDASVFP